jgi:hypothetical protein
VVLVPYRKAADEALAEWRDADRRLAKMTPDDPDWQSVYVLRELAKATYLEVVETARAQQLPEPTPFEDVAEATQDWTPSREPEARA